MHKFYVHIQISCLKCSTMLPFSTTLPITSCPEESDRLINSSRGKPFQLISMGSICALSILIGFSISQQIYSNYYDTLVSILIIIISYGIGAFFIVWLAMLFFSWYRSSHNLIVFLYFISMLIISFNLIMTAAWASAKLSPPHLIGEYVGSSGEMSPGRFQVLDFIYRVSSFLSFFSIWITTAILMNNYRESVVGAIAYWILLSIPRYARAARKNPAMMATSLMTFFKA